MRRAETESRRCALQAEIDAGKTIEDRRRMGQFATPGDMARAIVEETVAFLPDAGKKLAVLEPSMGTGSFVSAALDVLGKRVGEVRGYELDEDFHRAAVELWQGQPVQPVRGDFTRTAAEPVFDLVLANPPYVRHHGFGIDEKRRLQQLVKSCTGISISGLAGLYCHFLLYSQAWMKQGGVGVWLIPSEWMSVNYGAAIRKFLTENVTLLRVHRFDAEDVRFSDALVSSCVVWFRNAPSDGTEALFTFGPDIHNPKRSVRMKAGDLRRAAKWPPRKDGDAASSTWRIGDFFDIRRGVVTGDNGFFVMTEDEAKSRGISKRYLRPILPSPRHLRVNHVEADADGLPTNAERRYLLDCTGYALGELPGEVRDYLETGVETTARKHLCAARTVWYEQEQRNPTPFLCSYMGRGDGVSSPVRFILNDTRAIVSNSFLMMYPKQPLSQMLKENPGLAEEVWAFLSGIRPQAIVSAGRSYGGGLQKVEPRELASVPCDELHRWMQTRCGESRPLQYRTDAKGNLLFWQCA